ncbi:hypothetical protein GCM10012289_51880 [Nonomuraea cavernae]|uniref:Uncharacterized protein n=1 Tax=Nonomuraea cavernae TaxID=2045107 RepID=A0A917Z734_9ACTN|nr:hypothetical protein GCM10012289_51880 [Nonomuraea cavernae]
MRLGGSGSGSGSASGRSCSVSPGRTPRGSVWSPQKVCSGNGQLAPVLAGPELSPGASGRAGGVTGGECLVSDTTESLSFARGRGNATTATPDENP